MKEKREKMNFFKAYDAEFLILRSRKEFTFCGLQGGNRFPEIVSCIKNACESGGLMI
jgi:hypothetical protein